MLIQVNSDNQTEAGSAEIVEDRVREGLQHIADRLTRVEVHLSGANGPKGGVDDKICALEVRPAGMKPLAVSAEAASINAAVDSAIEKFLTVWDRQVGRMTSRKGH